MKTVIQKWGNSLAIRFPKALADEFGMKVGDEVKITSANGRIVLEPVAPRYNLDTLLKAITNRNRHKEIDTGRPVGKEIW